MSIFRKRQAQNVSEWLEIATEALAPAAKERIRADIASHYDEAVDEHFQNGLPMPAAHAAALAELGDAKIAARRFRRAHLTQSELWHVACLLQYALLYGRSGVGLVLNLGFCWFFWLMVPASGGRVSFGNILGHVLVALILVCSLADFILAKRKSASPIVPWLVLIQSLRYLLFGMLILTCLAWQDEIEVRASVPLALFTFGYSLFHFQLRNKLGKAGEDWMGESVAARNEIPPDKPVAS